MHDQMTVGHQRQRLMAQPVEQLVAVGRVQDVVQRIATSGSADTLGHREQVQVMIAEHGARTVAHGSDQPQCA